MSNPFLGAIETHFRSWRREYAQLKIPENSKWGIPEGGGIEI